MKKLAILIVLALEIAVCGCGSTKNTSTEVNTQSSGNWEAQLLGGTQQASLLNFVVTFNVINSGPLEITGFQFFNQGACFGTLIHSTTQSGTANFSTAANGTVTGTLNLTIKSTDSANSLALTGNLTGSSSATSGTFGNLSNGVVNGTWQLTGGAGDPSCSGSGTFLMCQGPNSTCTAP